MHSKVLILHYFAIRIKECQYIAQLHIRQMIKIQIFVCYVVVVT